MRRSHPHLIAIALLVLASAACSSPAPSATPAEPTMAVDADHVIELEMTAALEILRDGEHISAIPIAQGETYTFRVNNTAGYDHDFHIGTEADLSAGGHAHAGLQAWSAGIREFQYTFDTPGTLAFGCTIAGHYAQMKGVFDFQP
jgi:uncharacterized cupredoxin-like copper-binding protein